MKSAKIYIYIERFERICRILNTTNGRGVHRSTVLQTVVRVAVYHKVHNLICTRMRHPTGFIFTNEGFSYTRAFHSPRLFAPIETLKPGDLLQSHRKLRYRLGWHRMRPNIKQNHVGRTNRLRLVRDWDATESETVCVGVVSGRRVQRPQIGSRCSRVPCSVFFPLHSATSACEHAHTHTHTKRLATRWMRVRLSRATSTRFILALLVDVPEQSEFDSR
jgi:hypothetical protein